jgi:hypothetical protein
MVKKMTTKSQATIETKMDRVFAMWIAWNKNINPGRATLLRSDLLGIVGVIETQMLINPTVRIGRIAGLYKKLSLDGRERLKQIIRSIDEQENTRRVLENDNECNHDRAIILN